MDTTTIRAVTEADCAAWAPLWQGYQAFYRVNIDAATTAETWRRLLDPAEPMHAVLAWRGEPGRGGAAVGMANFLMHRSTWTTGDYCYLQDLFVDPGVRGGGIGAALIAHVRAEAEARGCSRLHWLTHETNTTAMRLYDRVAQRPGFVQYRILF